MTTESTLQYKLLDSGDGERLEQFGNNVIRRPDSNCIWHRSRESTDWSRASTRCIKEAGNSFTWRQSGSFNASWQCCYSNSLFKTESKSIAFALRSSPSSKNVGLFPEQAHHWDWFVPLIAGAGREINVLNLFAYTGGATLCAAAAGAKVCHVDASTSAVNWARQNALDNNLGSAPIRWIVEDCITFMEREVRRGSRYDAIIMDPPAFGRDPQGNVFQFEDAVHELLDLARQLLSDRPLFFIINGYGMNYSPAIIANVVGDYFPDTELAYGELELAQEGSTKVLPCNIFARIAF